MKKFFVVALVVLYSSTALAQNFLLLKKGISFSPKEDLQCMTNATSLKLIAKLRLCDETCEIKIDGITAIKNIEIELLESTVTDQRLMFTQVVAEKDTTIRDIETVAFKELSKQGSGWWKYMLVGGSGLLVGAAIAIGAIYAGKQ